jgi:hypothetical protein
LDEDWEAEERGVFVMDLPSLLVVFSDSGRGFGLPSSFGELGFWGLFNFLGVFLMGLLGFDTRWFLAVF